MATTAANLLTNERPNLEAYVIPPTPHVPNSKLPVLVYRNVLADNTTTTTATGDISPSAILSVMEPNGFIKGGQWKTKGNPATATPHFHSTTHECYAIMRGRATYLLGKGPLDADVDEDGREVGLELRVGKGDVFVLPAGISHRVIDSEDDYEFIGLYPDGLTWDMNYGKASSEETAEKAEKCRQVPIPEYDPVYGSDGSLPRVWKAAAAATGI